MASRQDRVDVYKKLITEQEAQKQAVTSGDGKFIALRVVSFAVACLTLAYALLAGEISYFWALIPAGIFGLIVLFHENKLKEAGRAQKRIDFYEAGIRRIEGDWQEDGLSGEEFIDREHLFSGDLNLFGKASLFQKMRDYLNFREDK